ncbi:MAG: glycosyltransferase [uncultured bacterium]|nr:MAG: glycosyltransferase [uncultured bacterium]
MQPKVSIIIPIIEINDYIRESIPKILEMDYENFEIIVHVDKPTKESWSKTRIIVGERKNETPPVKRDLAVKAADGEIIAFLDDDAYPRRDWLKNAVRHFEHNEVGAVYGPGVTPKDDGVRAKVSGEILSSPLTSWKYVYRYLPAGKFFREKKLLNCKDCSMEKNCEAKEKIFTVDDAPSVNLLIKKKIFEKAGGFNTKYYPGEDTKLCLDIVDKQKKKIVYDPDVFVWHHRRNSFYKHFQQNVRYAMHRGFFAKKYPKTSLRWQYFIPTIFGAFLALSVLVLIFQPFDSYLRWFVMMILLLYVLLLIYFGLISAMRQKNILIGLIVIPGIFFTHLVYGVGVVIGLFKKDLRR